MIERINFLKKLSMWSVIVIFLALLAFFYLANRSINLSVFIKSSSWAVFVTGILLMLYERFAWKWKWINIVNLPVLHRKYRGFFISDFDKKERIAELKIKQNFLVTSVTFKTKESFSATIVASIEKINGVKFLVYLYLNNPRGDILNVSPMHYGVNMLNIEDVDVLEGNYFTSRKTGGHMKLEAVK